MLTRVCAGGVVFFEDQVFILKNDKGEWVLPKVPKEDCLVNSPPTSGLNYLELLKKAYDENLAKTLGDLAYTCLGTPAQEKAREGDGR